MIENKKLFRSRNGMIAGVCGGIAEFFGLDPTIVRLAYAVVTLLSVAFPGIIIYILCWIIIPKE